MKRSENPGIPLLILAMASGISALAYELLWERELALVFGASQYAVATVLAAFMAGLGLGAHAGGKLADHFRNPLRVLGLVELLMAVLGPSLTLGFHHIPGLAAHILPDISVFEPSALGLRFGLSFVLMLPATLLMGASFPLMVRSTGSEPGKFHRGIAWLYAANTAGGVLGVLGASFFLLPHFGVSAVVATGAVSNLLAAGIATGWRRSSPVEQTVTPQTEDTAAIRPMLLALAALSGGAVLAGETLWNRVLAIVLPNSTYTFAILLAIYLLGLSAGGFLVRKWIGSRRPILLWARIQLLMAGWMLAVIPLCSTVPVWIRHHRPPAGWGRVLLTPLSVGGLLILPAALLLGAAWPLLLAAAAPQTETGGRRIGKMSLLNSAGAAVGAGLGGWMLLPLLGFGGAFLSLAALHLLMFTLTAAPGRRRLPALAVIVLVGCALLLPDFLRIPLPSTTARPEDWRTLFYREGPTGTVTVLEDLRHGGRSLYVDNSSVIGDSFDALKVARMLGLLPVLLHPDPEASLVIGFGAGVTTATLAAAGHGGEIVAREIVPTVAEAAPFFNAVNHGILNDPRLHLGFGDGRNALLISRRKWDIITCDPIHPLYGSAPLYSADFFSLALSRLRSGGIFCQYLPLHQMPPEAFRHAIYTFTEVFPHSCLAFSMGHAVLIGSNRHIELDWQQWRHIIGGFTYPADLRDSCLDSAAQITTLFQLDRNAMRESGLPPASTDRRPILEFLEPAAFEPHCWEDNARTLIEAYVSPLDKIRGLPPELQVGLRRLLAAKRLLLFAQLELRDARPANARNWLRQALQLAPGDPEIRRFAREFTRPQN